MGWQVRTLSEWRCLHGTRTLPWKKLSKHLRSSLLPGSGKKDRKGYHAALARQPEIRQQKITTRVDSFWLDNSLKITPDEEMGLVKKLYFGQLPFQKRTQDIVKKVMLQEDNANYKLSYKTGWGFPRKWKIFGLVVGWIEENKHPYFFVLNVEGAHDAKLGPIRLEILKAILKQNGFLEGKR
jgi:beta-lactamase class D